MQNHFLPFFQSILTNIQVKKNNNLISKSLVKQKHKPRPRNGSDEQKENKS